MPAFMDVLTGSAGHEAAQNQRSVLSTIIPNLATTGQSGYAQAGDALRTGFAGAQDQLGQGYGAATGAINQGAGGALGYLDQGQQGAMGQLGQARGDLTANGGAYAPLSALASQYGQGAGLYADALGINGAGGNARAVSAYQHGPGFESGLNMGIDAINRRRNAAGSLNGGNADRDAQIFGMDYQNQDYGKYLDRLSAYNPLQLSATQGAAAGNAGINSTLANLGVAGAGLLNSGGRDRAGVATGQGNSLADLANRYYGGQAGLSTAQGGALAGNDIGAAQNWQGVFGNALPQWNNTYQQDAAATNAAGTNQINLGMNLARLAVGAAAGGGLPSFGGGSAAVADPSFGGFSLPGTNAWSARA
jgi:hypothetical protein